MNSPSMTASSSSQRRGRESCKWTGDSERGKQHAIGGAVFASARRFSRGNTIQATWSSRDAVVPPPLSPHRKKVNTESLTMANRKRCPVPRDNEERHGNDDGTRNNTAQGLELFLLSGEAGVSSPMHWYRMNERRKGITEGETLCNVASMSRI